MFIVFRMLGRDYDAALIVTGYTDLGIPLASARPSLPNVFGLRVERFCVTLNRVGGVDMGTLDQARRKAIIDPL